MNKGRLRQRPNGGNFWSQKEENPKILEKNDVVPHAETIYSEVKTNFEILLAIH